MGSLAPISFLGLMITRICTLSFHSLYHASLPTVGVLAYAPCVMWIRDHLRVNGRLEDRTCYSSS